MIKGITVRLEERNQIGFDDFNNPIYGESNYVEVDNVIVAPASDTDIIENLQLYGKRAVYTLGIPKGDNHNWSDVIVEFFGQRFRTFGAAAEGMKEMIPLKWNKKVQCELHG